MRLRMQFALGAASGLVSGVFACLLLGQWGVVKGDALALVVDGMLSGTVLGILMAGVLAGMRSRPVVVTAVVLAIAPFATGASRVIGMPLIGVLPPLICPALVVMLAQQTEAREQVRLNLLTAAVVAYACMVALGIRGADPTSALELWAGTVPPIGMFFVGMMLAGPPSSSMPLAQTAAFSPTRRETLGRARVFRAMVAALVGGALALTLVTLVAELVLPSGWIPAQGMMPSASALAAVLGLALVIAFTWDADRALLRTLVMRGRYVRRAGVALALVVTLALLQVGLALTWSRVALLAVAVALLWVGLLRGRMGGLIALLLLGLPLVAIVPRGPEGWIGSPWTAMTTALGHGAWTMALLFAQGGALGQGAGAAAGALPDSQYLLVTREVGLPGLLALVALFAIALVQLARNYQRLRPASTEAGMVQAASGALVFVGAMGLVAAPLAQPGAAMAFWLLLGLANGVEALIERSSAAVCEPWSGIRGLPLRVAYVVDGADDGESAIALLEHLHALDRGTVVPLLVSLGPGVLVDRAPTAQVSAQVTPRHVRAEPEMVEHWLAARSNRLAEAVGSHIARKPLRVVAMARAQWSVVHEWSGVVRAILALRPDLIVSVSSEAHLPALFAGRWTGVPVQWRICEPLPAALRPLHDALLPWTSGAIAASRAASQGLDTGWRIGRARTPVARQLVRIVPTGVRAVAPPSEAVEHTRHALGLETLGQSGVVLVVPGEITSESGHQDLLDALVALQPLVPGLRVVFVAEAPTGGGQCGLRTQRLRRAVEIAGLGDAVHFVGRHEDVATVIALADVAVFPQISATHGRGVLQAMACGLPIIATRVGAVPELLDEAWGCELVNPGDAQALAMALLRVLSQLTLYHAQARRNPSLVREWFGASGEAQALAAIYQQACLPRQSGSAEAREGHLALARQSAAHFPTDWQQTLRGQSAPGDL